MVSDQGKPRPILKGREKLFLRVPFPFPLMSGTSCLKGRQSYPPYKSLSSGQCNWFPRRGIHQDIYLMESSIQLLNNWGLDESRIKLYQYIKVSMYLHCGCCDNYALIAVSTIHNSRGVAKEKTSRLFYQSSQLFTQLPL